jgi:hypothetical protein
MLSTFSLPLTAAWSAAVVWTSEVTSLPDALRLEARMGFTDLIVTLEAAVHMSGKASCKRANNQQQRTQQHYTNTPGTYTNTGK